MLSQFDRYLLIPESTSAYDALTQINELGQLAIKGLDNLKVIEDKMVPCRADYQGKTVGYAFMPVIDEGSAPQVQLVEDLKEAIQDTFHRVGRSLVDYKLCACLQVITPPDYPLSFDVPHKHPEALQTLIGVFQSAVNIGLGKDVLSHLEFMMTGEAAQLPADIRSEAKFIAHRGEKVWIIGYQDHADRGDVLGKFEGAIHLSPEDVASRLQAKGVSWEKLQPSHEKARNRVLSLPTIKLTL